MLAANQPTPYKLLLVDDHRLLLDCLRSLLVQQIPGLEIVGECGNGLDATRLSARLEPNIIIMDIDMPGMSSFDAAREILRRRPGTNIIFLSAHATDAQISEALDCGARGYIVKTDGLSTVAQGITQVATGRVFLSPSVASRLQNPNDPNGTCTRREGLTPRENQILVMLAKGESVKRIAYDLSISYKTVDKHKVSLMHKLDIHDRVELCRFAVRESLIEA